MIHDGKPSWVQDAYLRLVRGADGWTAVWQRDLIASGLEDGDRLRAVRLAPVRGEVVGADDERLVWNQDAKRIGLDKTLVPPTAQPKSAAASPGQGGRHRPRRPSSPRWPLNGPQAYVEAAVIRAVGDDEWRMLAKARMVEACGCWTPCVRWPCRRPSPGSCWAAWARPPTTSSRPRAAAIRAGDLVGLGGLQRAHNATLMGVTGFVVQAYPDGHVEQARDLFRVPASPGGRCG